MSIQHDPTAPATRRRTTPCTPLLDLIRSVARQYGELTFRALPADHEHSETGYVAPHRHEIGLPNDPDGGRFLTTLVLSLYDLSLADADPRLQQSAGLFAEDATRRTLAAMDEMAR